MVDEERKKGYDWLSQEREKKGQKLLLAAAMEGRNWMFWVGFGEEKPVMIYAL